jgi:hypothetical protein
MYTPAFAIYIAVGMVFLLIFTYLATLINSADFIFPKEDKYRR